MKNQKAYFITIVVMAMMILVMTTLWIISTRKANQQIALNEALSDTLHKTRNALGEQTAKIQQLQTANIDDFLAIQSKDSTIAKLQKLVSINKSRLGSNGSASILEVNTTGKFTGKTDSIKSKDTTKVGNITYVYPEYKSSIKKDKWISADITSNKDSTTFIPKVHNEFNIILGEETNKKGLFHLFDKEKPFGEVTSLNPYSDISVFRTYQVSKSKPKHWGIGIQIGGGLNKVSNQVNTGWYIGGGLNYNLLNF